jgi:catalase
MRLMLAAVLAGLIAGAPARPARADDAPIEVRLVDVMNQIFGRHPGFRANHAKGAVFEGTFTPAPTAAALTTAVHLQSTPVPVTVRFSNAGGLPDAPDTHPSARVRGLAVKFHLPDGSETDMVMISLPAFPVANAEDFLALLQAVATSGPDAAKPTPIERFLGAHPATAKALSTPLPIPVSYATIPFFGINAFKFTNAKGETHFVRYQIVPEAGAHYLSDADAAKLGPNFLADDTRKRVATAPVKFEIYAQVAEAGDAITDPSIPWPDTRTKVELGELAITKAVPDSLTAEKALLFLPTNLTAGIDVSDDPMIPVRSAAYAESYGRRSQ